ncbi:hypothetical protein DPMN_152152 [Dreissena polymorpha]|uniref:Mab-21-like HhH/H2TH-like domain-containing protein n=1 Tax=Dreissena polymorpha TaxID=45954 RepID=A0A9D4FHS6_DREPO|nr:hypothetical protein DPMN_152152 [Dreissena polymorpha]
MTSLKLDKVMEDIGVTEKIILFRRHIHLLAETVHSMRIRHSQTRIFGSQIEGSTTRAMWSDTDRLGCSTKLIAISKSYSGHALKGYLLLLAIEGEMSLPQCCSLQVVKLNHDGKIVPFTAENMDFCMKENIGDAYILDQKSRVLFSNNFLLNIALSTSEKATRSEVEKHGPAVTLYCDADAVYAIHCLSMPDDCKVFFTKLNQSGHWPKLETKIKANKCGVYLVAPGHISHTFNFDPVRSLVIMHVGYARDYLNSQWRMSTNMTERLLMFDLNIVHMKTYILTKMIRKELLKPIVGDRLSTFHMKTTLLFTVGTYPEDIWTKANLVQCVHYCLITLRRFLKRRVCPHYTVSSVNLFNDKLRLHEYQQIIDALSVIINSPLKCIETLRMDHIGERLLVSMSGSSNLLQFRRSYWFDNLSQIITSMVRTFLHMPVNRVCGFNETHQELKASLHFLAKNIKTSIQNGSDYCEELGYILKYIYNTLASMNASKRIAMKRPIDKDVIKMYEMSLSPMHITNYLKYASMLVCTHQYTRAEALLQHVESLISPDMIHISINRPDGIRKGIQAKTAHFAGLSSPTDILMRYVSKMLVDVVFNTEEIYCVPSHLAFEMYRNGMEEECNVRERYKPFEIWMKDVAVEVRAEPFLHYLQYLSSKDVFAKQLALIKLIDYCSIEFFRNPGHFETTLNLVGHIFEWEKRIPDAWNIYRISVQLVPQNNAAYWHLFRLLGDFIYGK